MEFEFPAEAEEFRTELRAFMAKELPPWWTHMFAEDERAIPFTIEFCKKLAANDWLTMAWPKEYGGADADTWHQMVVREEMWAAGEPRGPQYMNLNYLGPAIMMFGTEEQKEKYIKPMAAGEVIWCQGFSEPGAGSDLASLTTRADDTGNGFRINGQKIWISYAPYAKHCMLLARTDPDAPRHRGISVFLVAMDTPGITVRPIDSMAGPIEFNELFFDDVEVPYECVLGPVDQGWTVTVSALARERTGFAGHQKTDRQLDLFTHFARESRDSSGRPLLERPELRRELMRLRTKNRAGRLMMYRAVSKQADDQTAEVDAAISKVTAGECAVEAGELAMRLAGVRGQLYGQDPWKTLAAEGAYKLWAQALPTQIALGSSEIQRNIIAQRGLGIPRK